MEGSLMSWFGYDWVQPVVALFQLVALVYIISILLEVVRLLTYIWQDVANALKATEEVRLRSLVPDRWLRPSDEEGGEQH